MIARQLTLYAAREKDGHRRCDLEAGMAIVVSVLERRIRAHPEQWLVTGRVWPEEGKTEP